MKNVCVVMRVVSVFIFSTLFLSDILRTYPETREERRERELQELQERFKWWPTDATPGPIKDDERGGYWWWPTTPGTVKPWGNRGYIYVYKIIFDYMAEEFPPPKPQELRPSLLIKQIHKNVKIYFDYDKADLRTDHKPILESVVKTLNRNPQASILIAGNCDRRGSEAYNLELGRKRAETVKQFMIEKGIPEGRIRIISRGKLDAVAPIHDLMGMQRDRNAQFMVAEVEEVMIPYPGEPVEEGAVSIEEGKYLIEKDEHVESQIKVSTRQYIVRENDTLWKIAQEQLGSGHRWKYLYEFNKDLIKNPDKLGAGTIIIIPVEQAEQEMRGEDEYTMPKPSLRGVEADAFSEEMPKERVLSGVRQYKVKKNDSLWKIAKQQLGDGNRWKEIYELNKERIKDPDRLNAEQVIFLPSE